jgi:methionyl-tRNA synthetase
MKDVENEKLRDGIRKILKIYSNGKKYMKIIKNWVIMKGSDEERDKEGKVIGI